MYLHPFAMEILLVLLSRALAFFNIYWAVMKGKVSPKHLYEFLDQTVIFEVKHYSFSKESAAELKTGRLTIGD